MDQPSHMQDVLMDVHDHVISPGDFHVDLEEGKQEEDDPNFVIARAAAREDPQLTLGLQELRRLKRRAEQSLFQQNAERAHRAALEAQRRSRMTAERLLDERYRRSISEAERRRRLTEQQQDEERRRHNVLEAERRGRLTEEQQEEARRRHAELEAERLARMTEEQLEEMRQRQSQRQMERTENEVEETLEQRRVQRRTKRYKAALANQDEFEVSRVSGKNIAGRHKLPEPTSVCSKCRAWKWPGESSITCCIDGKVALPPLQPAPAILRKWYQDEEFLKQIRMYNQVFAFTSLGASLSNRRFNPVAEDQSVQGQRGVYTYRIQGTMGHFLGSLLPYTDQAGQTTKPKFAQIYVYDPDVEARVARRRDFLWPEQSRAVGLGAHVGDVQRVCASQRMRSMIEAGDNPVNVVFRLRANNYAGPRTHNLPTATEVAAVLVDDGNAANNRDFLLFPRSGGLLRLFETHSIYDSLQCPLLLPLGELGWTYTDEYMNGTTYRNKTRMALRGT
ncbi:uncharacterized protein LOC133339040 [Lethenteron reissneri]|uniref:uncharacterized protein LOC133339040 n=1 Tax=Lethenteron reissneri TaxID=7753 RepID=UPI002AB6B94B|nr:uncharacterized protein LOC133339040 [Lethenteron reissneri]